MMFSQIFYSLLFFLFIVRSYQLDGLFSSVKSSLVTNITTSIGKNVVLNCSMNSADYFKIRSPKSTTSFLRLNPTWLKSDASYDQSGVFQSYQTEKIIVTRKGIVLAAYRNKIKLIINSNSDQFITISDVDISDEGKYICREFSTQMDHVYYVYVQSPIKELSLKFESESKYFGETSDTDYESNKLKNKYGTPNMVTIRENDQLVVKCSVESSKPAANLSVWLLKNSNFQQYETYNNENYIYDSLDNKHLPSFDHYINKNGDMTLKSSLRSKYAPTRYDNHKYISCIAENQAMNEKWETRKVLNVLYGPKCDRNQKLLYQTGINQSIELECHMTEANPLSFDFSWNFMNTKNPVKERSRTNGLVSRINWTPKSEDDFGEITCLASNGFDLGECRIRVELGGPPNPPHECYHKENNKTIIIECKPGYHQGDPDVYFYLLKKKPNGALVEYARKRDSCSFLISNFILEEHMNEFYVYSSNKYGNNKEKPSKMVIENKEFLVKNLKNLERSSMQVGSQTTIYIGLAALVLVTSCMLFCLFSKCKTQHSSKPYRNSDYASGQNYSNDYKYSSHQSNYNSDYLQKKEILNEKELHSPTLSNSSENDGIYDNKSYKKASYTKLALNKSSVRSPSLINNIQDLDMSPKSKRKSTEKLKDIFYASDSFIVETTETDSENYMDLNKNRKNDLDDKPRRQSRPSSNSNTLRSNRGFSIEKANIWYGNTNSVDLLNEDIYTGISVDKPNILYENQPYKIKDMNSFGAKKLNGGKYLRKSSDTYDNLPNQEMATNHRSMEFEKTRLFANESLDVDDDKLVGILV